MGNYQTPGQMSKSLISSKAGRCLIVAAEGYIVGLKNGEPLRGVADATMISLPAAAPLPNDAVRGAVTLVLEVDASDEASLKRLTQARAEHPSTAIIAALQHADVALVRTLVRQGVSDVVQLPFVAHELSAQILDTLSSKAVEEPTTLGQTVAVLRATGGCGSTTLGTHLAKALVQGNTSNLSVCLVDLDIQGGDVASYLGVEPSVTVDALLDAGTRLDQELVRSAVTDTRHGFHIIAAPSAIAPIDKIDIDHLLAFLQIVRSQFDYVLLDLPPAWTDWSLSIVHSADHILLITDTAISSLRQAKKRIALLNGIDVDNSRIEIVVNRLERRLFRTVSLDQVTETLGCDVAQGLSDETALREAQDQGMLLTETHGKTRFGSEVDTLAKRFLSGNRSD